MEEIFRAAVEAVEPGRLVRQTLERSAEGISLRGSEQSSFVRWNAIRNICLVGGGKAGRPMGEAAIGILGEKIKAGVLAVPRGKGGESGPVRFVEAGHPFPDGGSREAAEEMLRILAVAGEEDLVVALLSGGGSSMISLPADGISPADKDETSRLLMNAGADISEINTVRKLLSRVKGGRMALAAVPARVFALLLSDVPGDDPSVIASGPFSPDTTISGNALEIVARRGILAMLPNPVRSRLESGAAGNLPDAPKPGDRAFDRVSCAVVGSNRAALEAACAAAKRPGSADVRVLPGFLRGEARLCARDFVSELKRASASAPPGREIVLIAGGETAVTVRGGGKGGRCQEFALSAAIEMAGESALAVLCAGTDGIDGPTGAAGAYADGKTCARAASIGLSPAEKLENNDAYPFFAALSDLAVTGATGTNVADIAIGLVSDYR
ncbi:MAG: DUF4147 domain-containing protein [Deltaproteobacteria bacterium]|nr:DUF4147 domain-containing protein [Deltaproteobacteria bacterium]